MRVKITKIKDNKFGGNHPNGIFEGAERIGELIGHIAVGQPVKLIHSTSKLFITSPVTKIGELCFETENSTYLITTVSV